MTNGLLVLLSWIERGYATREGAERAGRPNRPSWTEATRLGYFTENKGGDLRLTVKGKAWLASAE